MLNVFSLSSMGMFKLNNQCQNCDRSTEILEWKYNKMTHRIERITKFKPNDSLTERKERGMSAFWRCTILVLDIINM